MTSWYIAHVITRIEFIEGEQEPVPVWEDCILVRASTHDEARARAEAHGKANAAVKDLSMTWEGRRARMHYVGVRKIIKIDEETLGDGIEVTYSQYLVPSLGQLRSLAAGGAVSLRYEE